jgi:beta-N-acetylhexosaminidase
MKPLSLPLGPVMVDVVGTVLAEAERVMLCHPTVGGVILFQRNYSTPDQLRALTREIHALRSPHILIAVDHEGGRVQRFQTGFTRIPPMRSLGALYDHAEAAAGDVAQAIGLIMAHELVTHGVDLTFAPVLDIDFGGSSVIGDRAFHRSPAVVAQLAARLVAGMRMAGMGAVGKHFPGHGFVRADSHHELPIDARPYAEIAAEDLWPYRTCIPHGLAGVMPAHVIYRAVDAQPAGFSKHWLQDILRGELGFPGIVFSDDLSMEGAAVAGGIVERANAAFAAGCDMVLVCNAPAAASELLAKLDNPGLAQEKIDLVRPPADDAAIARRVEDYYVARRTFAAKFSV